MNKIEFYKYQGTGNDFVMVDNRGNNFPKHQQLIEQLCNRRFGVGGDGLIILEKDSETDFKMVYYNSDGNESSMCGNGGRCVVALAHFLKIFENQCTFNAIDGVHKAQITNGIVKLKMIDVQNIKRDNDAWVMNTGSPHYVKFSDEVETMNVKREGQLIRNSENYKKEGINVNFVKPISDNQLFVRTYERGVEDETFSCGTGATASALAYMMDKNTASVQIKVLGGNLKIYAEKTENGFKNVWLEGSAQQVFKGEIFI